MRKAHVFALGLLAVVATGCMRYQDISTQMTRHKLRTLEKRHEQFNGTYEIGIPDSVNINIPDHPDLSGTYELRLDGNISFPLLRDVYIEGLTPIQLSDMLRKRLHEFVRQVEVLVTVTGMRSHSCFVYSRSRAGGKAFTYYGDTTLLDLLTLHGGWNREDFSSRIRLIRAYPGKKTDPGEPEVYRIRADRFVRGDLSTNVLIKENDMVYIPATWLAEVTYFVSAITAPIRSIFYGAREAGGIPYAAQSEYYRNREERDRYKDDRRR